MEELFDVFDRDGNYLGVKPRSFCHSENPGVYHKPAWVWIVNEKNQVLVQRRASTKAWFPNVLDGSATGHVEAGESAKTGAVREIQEELGIGVKEENLDFIGEFLAEDEWEFGQVFFTKISSKTPIKINEIELSQVSWFDFEEFEKRLYSDEFAPYSKEYKDWTVLKLRDYLHLL